MFLPKVASRTERNDEADDDLLLASDAEVAEPSNDDGDWSCCENAKFAY